MHVTQWMVTVWTIPYLTLLAKNVITVSTDWFSTLSEGVTDPINGERCLDRPCRES